jgi:tetratricopeptide (TPR) repeat protein
MRRILIFLAAALIGLGCAPIVLRARQGQPAPNQAAPSSQPVPATDDNSDGGPRYYPPGPRKSVEIGNFYLRKKDYRGALSRFQEARETDPNYAAAYLGLGKVYEKIGLKQKALDAYRKYLDALPSDKDALEAKDAQKAIARLQKELKIPSRQLHQTTRP